MQSHPLTWSGLALVALVFLAVTFEPVFIAEVDPAAEPGLIRYGVLLGLLVVAVAVGWQRRSSIAVKTTLLWSAVVAAVLIAVIALPQVPATVTAMNVAEAKRDQRNDAPGVVNITAERNGHFVPQADVNGTYVDFFVDTGATVIALSPLDAQRIGFDLRKLDYNVEMTTANGRTMAAYVVLDRVSIGDITIRDVPAVIHDEGLDISLLGMSFLSKLRSFEIQQDRLVLEQ